MGYIGWPVHVSLFIFQKPGSPVAYSDYQEAVSVARGKELASEVVYHSVVNFFPFFC